MLPMNELADAIKDVFVHADDYQMDKYVRPFNQNGDFLGDCFNIIAVEPHGQKPPTFYHTFSPYDVISGKAPDQALVFEDGELLLNLPFAAYIRQRTGVMAPLILRELGVKSLVDKKGLLIGSGGTAQSAW